MIGALDISTSALVAQRVRLDTIAGNIANASSLQNEKGEAKPFSAVMAAGLLSKKPKALGCAIESELALDKSPLNTEPSSNRNSSPVLI